MSLTKYKLSDVAKVEISSVDKKTKENESLVRLCNFTDVYHNWAITADLADKFMSASANAKEIEKFTIKKGQVAFTKDSETRDDIGIPTYIADNFDNVLLGYHCALITPDETKVCGKYLNAFMHSSFIQKYFENCASGSGQRYTLSLEALERMPLLLPSLEEQKRVGDMFSAIDKKISLNRAINQNLEAMAKQLYDYWFVQFDFPDENGRPYKSSGGKMVWNEKLKREIPEKWNSNNICLIADILSGGTPSKQINEYWDCGHIPFFGPTDYDGSMFQLHTADTITEFGLKHCSSSLFEENTVIITARGSIGKLVIVGTPMAMNQSCYALRAKTGKYEYLYFLTAQLIDNLKTKGSGSVFKSIITSDIESTMLCIANEEVISLYCDKISPIMKLIKKNTQEIPLLIKQRDKLLPLLMNGQITIE